MEQLDTLSQQEILSSLCADFSQDNLIDPGYYAKWDVKRGLRNADGTGVVAGVTQIGNVRGYYIQDGEKVPMPGQLFYRGIAITDLIQGFRDQNRFGFGETIGRSFVYSFKIAGSIFRVIGELFTGRLGLNALGGPVTTITTTASVASQSFRSFLEIAGFIGVNLAVFNLLPIPALDGSKVVFTVIEWIRGKPISRKVETIIHAVGFVLLIGFAILVDILQFV